MRMDLPPQIHYFEYMEPFAVSETANTSSSNLGGRPTDYTPQLRDEICRRLASGRTLRSVCRDEDMPSRETIYNWITANKGEVKEGEKVVEEGFFDHYKRAREIGMDEFADETVEIADESSDDYVETEDKNGKPKVMFNKEAVLRSKLRCETRWKYLENMAPRKYGKNVTVRQQQLDAKGEPTDPAMSRDTVDEFLGSVLDAITKHGGAPEDGKKPA